MEPSNQSANTAGAPLGTGSLDSGGQQDHPPVDQRLLSQRGADAAILLPATNPTPSASPSILDKVLPATAPAASPSSGILDKVLPAILKAVAARRGQMMFTHALVCRRWLQTASEVQSTLMLSWRTVPPGGKEALEGMLRSFPNIQKLQLARLSSDQLEDLAAALETCSPSVRNLVVVGIDWDAEALEAMESLLRRLPQLTAIEQRPCVGEIFNLTNLERVSFSINNQHLQRLSGLRSLKALHMKAVTADSFEMLMSQLMTLDFLQDLDLEGDKDCNENPRHYKLPRSPVGLSSLTRLKLGVFPVLRPWGKFLAGVTHLAELSIVGHLPRTAVQLSSLRKLTLVNPWFHSYRDGPEDDQLPPEYLSQLTSLTCLSIQGVEKKHQDLFSKRARRVLPQLPLLRKLSIKSNFNTLAVLCNVNLQGLRTLDVSKASYSRRDTEGELPPRTHACMRSLEVLKFPGTLPEGISRLRRLKGLSCTALDQGQEHEWMLQPSVAELTTLQQLTVLVDGYQLAYCTNASEVLSSLPLLTSLALEGEGLHVIPSAISSLQNLRHLTTASSSLPSLPDWLSKLTALEVLDISKCSCAGSIPPALSFFPCIRWNKELLNT